MSASAEFEGPEEAEDGQSHGDVGEDDHEQQ